MGTTRDVSAVDGYADPRRRNVSGGEFITGNYIP